VLFDVIRGPVLADDTRRSTESHELGQAKFRRLRKRCNFQNPIACRVVTLRVPRWGAPNKKRTGVNKEGASTEGRPYCQSDAYADARKGACYTFQPDFG